MNQRGTFPETPLLSRRWIIYLATQNTPNAQINGAASAYVRRPPWEKRWFQGCSHCLSINSRRDPSISAKEKSFICSSVNTAPYQSWEDDCFITSHKTRCFLATGHHTEVVRSEPKGMKPCELQHFSKFQLRETVGHFGRIHHLYRGFRSAYGISLLNPFLWLVRQRECPRLKHQESSKQQKKIWMTCSWYFNTTDFLQTFLTEKTRNPNPPNPSPNSAQVAGASDMALPWNFWQDMYGTLGTLQKLPRILVYPWKQPRSPWLKKSFPRDFFSAATF